LSAIQRSLWISEQAGEGRRKRSLLATQRCDLANAKQVEPHLLEPVYRFVADAVQPLVRLESVALHHRALPPCALRMSR
jgi:hypothetical protein